MLTVVIPIKNNAGFLWRLLRYCVEVDFHAPLFIADSSDSQRVGDIRRVVEAVSGRLAIDYRAYDSDILTIEKLREALSLVRTTCVAIGADDDFFVPEGLRRAVELLRACPEFSGAQGDAALFMLDGSAEYGEVSQLVRYRQRTLMEATGTERLLSHFTHYSTTWHSVQRSEQLRRNIGITAALQLEPAFFTELVLSGLSVIQGKIRKLDGLYMVRQAHHRRRGPGVEVKADGFEWVTSPDWADQYQRARECLAEELAARDEIPIDQAREVVKLAFWRYLAWLLSRVPEYGSTGKSADRGGWRRLARAIPGVRRTWRALCRPRRDEMSLRALLRASSPYHDAFMPVYRILTAPPDAAIPGEAPKERAGNP